MLTIAAMGDVMINRPDRPGYSFELVQPWLDRADLVFGNCEGVFGDDLVRAPSCVVPCTAPAHNVESLQVAGFDVMSCANNHAVDAGHAGLLGTLELLRSHGIATTGAGPDLASARKPAILERAGRTIAVLAYASVFPAGYDAGPALPGIAPMRALTHYAPPGSKYYSPGEPAVVTTFPEPQDLAALVEDVQRARASADVVLTSFHWGLFSTPEVVTDYERAYARTAIDAGADAVIGHHHHTLRALDHHRDRPILYGLGHFAFDVPRFGDLAHRDGVIADITERRTREDGASAINPQEDYPYLPFGPDGRKTALAQLQLLADGTWRTQLLLCVIRPSGQVEPVDPASSEGADVEAFLRRACESQGMPWRTALPSAAVKGVRSLTVLN